MNMFARFVSAAVLAAPLAAQAAMRSHLKASEHRWVGG